MTLHGLDPAPSDPDIRRAVEALQAAGLKTFESRASTPGHSSSEPAVRFRGDGSDAFRALTAVLEAGLPLDDLRRAWPMDDGDPIGPWWEMTFRHAGTGDSDTYASHAQ